MYPKSCQNKAMQKCCCGVHVLVGLGRQLTVGEMGKLMGHDLTQANLPVSEYAMKHMLGMSVHKGIMGMALMILLASVKAE